jgi:UDP-N-acetylmuramoyl-tripeptide--D-alanyl-D-alanine ligase
VVEVGSRGVGHITWLMPAVRPDVAVVTNLGVAHLEFFGSAERLADAKWELVAALGEGGTAVVPYGDVRLQRPHAGRTVTFGRDAAADVTVSPPEIDEQGRPAFDLITAAGTRHLRMATAGAHQALNAAAAAAAGLALGVDLDTICAGLEQAVGSPWRMEIHQGRFTVVNDAYNANPDSVLAALETVASMPGRHVAVLGRMAELGPIEAEEHHRVGTVARRLGYAAVVTVGTDPGVAAGAGDVAHPTDDVDQAFDVVTGLIGPGDVVLVKASRAVGLEKLAERLAAEAAS